MKRMLLSFALWVSPLLLVWAQENKSSDPVTGVILKAEQQWEDALTRSDAGTLDRLYDERIVYTHSNGKVDTKSSYLAAIKTGATKYLSMARDDIKVTIYGKTAVVTCHWAVHVLAQGNKIDTDARYLHVYVQQKDAWKLVAHQSTRISP
jgi:ketosteroid isomerase-like protein